ncbi:MAG TPA: HAD family hydrolase, partial [Ktedonobacterales bacterium]|jgi:phosphoglycolate phosphatase-like HAD superfamily hydrolase
MLFLFDIDGTLVRRLPPAHRDAICAACLEVYGVTLTPAALGGTAGMTDRAILRRALLAAGLDATTIAAGLPAFLALAADAYDRLVDADLRAYRTPHAEEALRWLAERGVALGLVTGNIERVAWRKLSAAGLAEFFRCGAFGSEADARDDLPPLALARAEAIFGRPFAPQQVFVVGDTPADIACGAASGLRTIGVATGPEHTREHLRDCHPVFLLDDLRGLEALELGLANRSA